MGMLASPTSNTLLTLHFSALDTLSSVYGIRPPASTVRSKIAQARALSQMFQASTVPESARRPVHWHALVLTTSCACSSRARGTPRPWSTSLSIRAGAPCTQRDQNTDSREPQHHLRCWPKGKRCGALQAIRGRMSA